MQPMLLDSVHSFWKKMNQTKTNQLNSPILGPLIADSQNIETLILIKSIIQKLLAKRAGPLWPSAS